MMGFEEFVTERITELESELAECKALLTDVKATLVKADSTISAVAEQVMPTVNELMKSPIVKMLGLGK